MSRRELWKILLPPITALVMAFLYFLFHLHFMSLFLDYDQIVYFKNIGYSIDWGYVPMYNPHHLHFEWGGKFFHEFMVKYLGDVGFTDLFFNLRLRSLVASCTGLFFFVLFLRNITEKLTWGILGGLLLAFSHGYLHYAVKVDTGVFPAAFFPVILWIVERMEKAKRGLVPLSLLGGGILGLSVILHQYLAVACAAACLCLFLPGFLFRNNFRFRPFAVIPAVKRPQIDNKPAKRIIAVGLTAVLACAVVAAAYFYTGKTFYNLSFDEPTPEESFGRWRDTTFQIWLFAYQTADQWGHGLKNFDPRMPVRGLTDSFLSQKSGTRYNRNSEFAYDVDDPGSEQAFVDNQLAFFTLLSLAGTLFFLPGLLRRYRRSMVFLILCSVVYFVFFTYWEPFYFEFWLVPNILVISLGVLLVNFAGEKLSVLSTRIGRLPSYVYILFLVILFSCHNMLYYVVPYSRTRYMEGVVNLHEPEVYTQCFSRSVYRYPDDIYRTVYGSTVDLPGN